jgi:hypothetical protein
VESPGLKSAHSRLGLQGFTGERVRSGKSDRPPQGSSPGGAAHWDAAYRRRGFAGVSWFQSEPTVSLEMIAAAATPPDAPVVDVGGGASPLVDRLIEQGFTDVSVLDVSPGAIGEARQRLPPGARVDWLVQDVLSWRPTRLYSLWHDRAVFHFLVAPEQKEAYRRALDLALGPGGSIVIGTFAPDGPESCSGLPVARYSDEELAGALGDAFTVCSSRREVHLTPAGGSQPFTWIMARRSE